MNVEKISINDLNINEIELFEKVKQRVGIGYTFGYLYYLFDQIQLIILNKVVLPYIEKTDVRIDENILKTIPDDKKTEAQSSYKGSLIKSLKNKVNAFLQKKYHINEIKYNLYVIKYKGKIIEDLICEIQTFDNGNKHHVFHTSYALFSFKDTERKIKDIQEILQTLNKDEYDYVYNTIISKKIEEFDFIEINEKIVLDNFKIEIPKEEAIIKKESENINKTYRFLIHNNILKDNYYNIGYFEENYAPDKPLFIEKVKEILKGYN